MKYVAMMAMVVLSFVSRGQQRTHLTDSKSRIEPMKLAISYYKTTNLIFPFAIKSVDRGSAEILVQKAKGVENVLQVKAARDTFKETNLTIITADGALYSFLLYYALQPTSINIELTDKSLNYEPLAIFASAKDNQEKIQTVSEFISEKKNSINGPEARKNGVSIALVGLYVRENILYFQLFLSNGSNIGFDVDQLRFYIIDKKKNKRTASQQLEQLPIHVHGNKTTINDQSEQVIVAALEKFTIPEKKDLIIQLHEKNGGRNLSIKVSNKHIMEAIRIN